MTVDVYSVDREMENLEFEVTLMVELHVTSNMKTQNQDMCSLD